MTLTAVQWQFIAARLLTSTDKDAAEQVGIHYTRVADWKKESDEFAREYEAAFTDGVHVAQSYTRKLLGKVAQTYHEALDATDEDNRPNWKARLEATKQVAQIQGLLKDRKIIEGDADNPARMIIDVVYSDGTAKS